MLVKESDMEDHIFGENSQLKEFQCPVCLKQFSRKFTLDMHLLIHKGVKPHPCPFCGKCFRQKGTLMRHKALHSSNNLFHCSLCDRGFRQKNVFLHHLKHRHNVSTETLDRRKYRTKLKDYQSIMDTLPPFVHADSTAIASSEKHLDAMLFESLSTAICDSSGAEGTTGNTGRMCPDKQLVACTDIQPSNFRESDLNENSGKNTLKEFGYECEVCLKMYFEYDQYKQHVEEEHNNEEMLLECKPILLPLPCHEVETLPLDSLPHSNNKLTANQKVDNCSKSVSHQNNFNGVSSSNDVSENDNLCIPCQKNFRTAEEFECHVKTHVQSVLLNDCEVNENIKPTYFNPDSLSRSDSICGNVSSIPTFTDSSETVPEPPIDTYITDGKNMNGTSRIKSSQTLVGYNSNCGTKLTSTQKKTSKTLLQKQFHFPDSASSHVSKNTLSKQIQSSLYINNKPFLNTFKNKSKIMPSYSEGFCNLHKCKLCKKSYSSKLSFEYHMQMHLSSKGFNCGYCKKRFSSKQLLLSHTRKSHMKSFSCSSCSRLFSYRTLYFQHKKHCHDVSSQLQNLKNAINLPLIDIQKLLDSDTNACGIIGVIPISDSRKGNEINSKIGIPIVSLSSIKSISGLPFLNSCIEINGVLK